MSEVSVKLDETALEAAMRAYANSGPEKWHRMKAAVRAYLATLATPPEPVAWQHLTPDEQFTLAVRIAANVGYDLVPEKTIQGAEDEADAARPAFYAPSNRLHALGTDLGNVPLIKRAPPTEYAHLWTPLFTHPPAAQPPDDMARDTLAGEIAKLLNIYAEPSVQQVTTDVMLDPFEAADHIIDKLRLAAPASHTQGVRDAALGPRIKPQIIADLREWAEFEQDGGNVEQGAAIDIILDWYDRQIGLDTRREPMAAQGHRSVRTIKRTVRAAMPTHPHGMTEAEWNEKIGDPSYEHAKDLPDD